MVVALQLDVQPRVRERGQDLVQARDADAGQLRGVDMVDALPAPLDSGERRVVEEDRDAVAREPDVELHAVAAGDPHRGLEGGEGVLRGDPRVAAVREAERPAGARRSRAHPMTRCAATPTWSDG